MDTKVFDLNKEYEAGIETAAQEIAKGGLVVFPTETVYGLGADAFSPEAVYNIFLAKGRPADNPLIVHIHAAAQVAQVAKDVSPWAKKLMDAFWPGPFTVVLPARKEVPSVVRGGLETVGVRLPAHPAAQALIEKSRTLIAAPSANLSGKPSPTQAQDVVEDFLGRVGVILDGGSCQVGLESTVIDATGEVPVVLRPGGVTPEMIEAVTGRVEVAKAVLEGVEEGQKAASPGMKYKHYAPKAKVFIVAGDSRNTIAIKAISMYDKNVSLGKNPVVFCEAKSASLYGDRNVWVLGENPQEIAANLFHALWQADREKIDTIYFEALEAVGWGLAVMNRVIRAAGFHII